MLAFVTSKLGKDKFLFEYVFVDYRTKGTFSVHETFI